jgi:hypothetical protein
VSGERIDTPIGPDVRSFKQAPLMCSLKSGAVSRILLAGCQEMAHQSGVRLYDHLADVTYHFQNVGQGLFASGTLKPGHPRARAIRWVYDCGSLSSDKLITSGLSGLKKRFGRGNVIDLVALSHFDADHITGICRLLKKFRVETLLLPYVVPWKRLLIAIAEGIPPTDPLIRFYIDPVAYLDGVGGPGVGRIVFVMPGGGDGVPLEALERGGSGRDETGDAGLTMALEQGGVPEQCGKSKAKVSFLPSGGALRMRDLWEFVPYNDEEPDKDDKRLTENFLAGVADHRERLRKGARLTTKQRALTALKKHYDTTFGAGSTQRNAISLHLYSGPITGRRGHAYIESRVCVGGSNADRHRHVYAADYAHPSQGAVLYSGDAYLDSPDKLQRMISYLNEERILRVAVFQVMHHGSEHNWHGGVAARIAPLFSVFSSDPARHPWHHPHPPVLMDFLPYGPIPINKERSATFDCTLWVR